jgi:putative ABC transport system substrate-binding protein
MRRRELLKLLGVAAVWPVAAQAQKISLPVVGYLNVRPETALESVAVIQINQALAEMGLVEGRDFTSEYRWVSNQPEGLAGLASDLVRQQVAVIITFTLPEVLAAKAATGSTPIVFWTGADPVANGLVSSMNRPGGNLTGAANLNSDIIAKRLELLHELIPAVELIAYLTNPTNKAFAEAETNALQRATRALKLRLLVLNASKPDEIDEAFAALARDRVGGLVVGGDGYFFARRDQLANLATRYKIPAIFASSEYANAGGLLSYGTHYLDGFRIVGTYTGRILRGEKPANLPVQQITKLELILNAKTAKTLGIAVPPGFLARADEVIE